MDLGTQRKEGLCFVLAGVQCTLVTISMDHDVGVFGGHDSVYHNFGGTRQNSFLSWIL